ncbi:MAG: hypothetical protein WKF75_17600, partial [Singulisphaera sp.]
DLGGNGFFDELREAYAGAGTPITFEATDLLGWQDALRWGFLTLLKGFGHDVKLQIDDGEPQGDVFEAALGAMVDHTNVVRCTNGRRLAQEAAALFHGDMLDVACSRIDNDSAS